MIKLFQKFAGCRGRAHAKNGGRAPHKPDARVAPYDKKTTQRKKHMSEKREFPQKSSKRTLILLGSLIASCIIIYGLYRFLLATLNPEIVIISYMAVSTVVIFWYVLYNRGFSRKGITPEMLPASWDEEKKREFIEDGKYRLVRSKPLLILVIAFIFTFALEAFELFALPFLAEIFGA